MIAAQPMDKPSFITENWLALLVLLLIVIAIYFVGRLRYVGAGAALREVVSPSTIFIVVVVGASIVLERLLGPSFYALGSLLVVALVVRGFTHRRQAGALLLQVGDPPSWLPLVGVLVLLLMLLPTSHSWQNVFQTTWLAWCLLSIRQGLQLRERGLLSGFELLPWENIESHRFDVTRDTLVVSLRKDSFWHLFGNWVFTVPLAQQDEVKEILSSRVSVA